MLLLAFSLFLTEPAPLDMPRAEAFAVGMDGSVRLEDRYDKLDLWFSRTIIGRWIDDDYRVFSLSKLDVEPPTVGLHDTLTREDYVAGCVAMKRVRANHDVPMAFRRAIGLLSPCSIAEFPRPPRQLPHGYRDVAYWQSPTNESDIVCAFRKEKEETWHLAIWQLAEGDQIADKIRVFEDEFLGEEFDGLMGRIDRKMTRRPARQKKERPDERELLRLDAHHSIAAYDDWRFADSDEFTVLYDFPSNGFIQTLTNEFTTMRAKYAATMPSPIDGSNVLAVARIYASRAEYLDALDADEKTNLAWTAAYWSQQRRELVAYLPEGEESQLLETVRHEAFHQYLSYAASMIPTSPWLNEGYAQYFEDTDRSSWGEGIEITPETIKQFANILPGVMAMDYVQFYDGTPDQLRMKYRLAWSIAYFIEKGADKVRFQPFKDLKRNYIVALLKTQDMNKATAAAFGNEENFKLFVAEWKKFWSEK